MTFNTEEIHQDSLAEVLATKNKEEIITYLLPFEPLWYEIGLRCGITKEKLDEIKGLFATPNSCLRDVVNVLLKQGEMPVTSSEPSTKTETGNYEEIVTDKCKWLSFMQITKKHCPRNMQNTIKMAWAN